VNYPRASIAHFDKAKDDAPTCHTCIGSAADASEMSTAPVAAQIAV
jgi:hypothetical protein